MSMQAVRDKAREAARTVLEWEPLDDPVLNKLQDAELQEVADAVLIAGLREMASQWPFEADPVCKEAFLEQADALEAETTNGP